MARKNFKTGASKFLTITKPAEINPPIQQQEVQVTTPVEGNPVAEASVSIPSSSVLNGLKVPDGMKLNPLYVEKRTHRLQIVLQPSLYERIKRAAATHGVSVNNYIHTTLDAYTSEKEEKSI